MQNEIKNFKKISTKSTLTFCGHMRSFSCVCVVLCLFLLRICTSMQIVSNFCLKPYVSLLPFLLLLDLVHWHFAEFGQKQKKHINTYKSQNVFTFGHDSKIIFPCKILRRKLWLRVVAKEPAIVCDHRYSQIRPKTYAKQK